MLKKSLQVAAISMDWNILIMGKSSHKDYRAS